MDLENYLQKLDFCKHYHIQICCVKIYNNQASPDKNQEQQNQMISLPKKSSFKYCHPTPTNNEQIRILPIFQLHEIERQIFLKEGPEKYS